jgi:hypothetical protein
VAGASGRDTCCRGVSGRQQKLDAKPSRQLLRFYVAPKSQQKPCACAAAPHEALLPSKPVTRHNAIQSDSKTRLATAGNTTGTHKSRLESNWVLAETTGGPESKVNVCSRRSMKSATRGLGKQVGDASMKQNDDPANRKVGWGHRQL